jgi:hypothetical protein
MYGQPRRLPVHPSAVPATASMSNHALTPLFGHKMQLALLFLVLLFSLVSAHFGLFMTATSESGKENFANISMVNPIL